MSFEAIPLAYDPYRKHKFLILWDGKAVAAVSKISALSRTTEPVEFRSGGWNNSPIQVPGLTKWDKITLERGLTADPAFMDWAQLVNKYAGKGGTSEEHKATFRKDLRIELYDLANKLVMVVAVYRAWVTKFVALPELDAKSNDIAFETIECAHEGWEVLERNESDANR